LLEIPDLDTPEGVTSFMKALLDEMEILIEVGMKLQQKHTELLEVHTSRMIELNHLRNIVWGEENEEY
tara:strand:+ start:5904 stop:6107 length:204 start_codon:yes stop_codon:yes gene_type:complete